MSLGLILHELATNSAKYGALSVPEGQVRINWSVDTGDESVPMVEFRWSEAGGPEVTQPASRGFGTRMMKFTVTSELEGDVELNFLPDGLTATLKFPTQ